MRSCTEAYKRVPLHKSRTVRERVAAESQIQLRRRRPRRYLKHQAVKTFSTVDLGLWGRHGSERSWDWAWAWDGAVVWHIHG
jgi:hypothetical protein